MKNIPIAGLVVALLALIIAIVGFSGSGAVEAKGPALVSADDLARVEKTVGDLASRLDKMSTRLDKLTSTLSALSDRASALAGSVEELGSREVAAPAAPAAAGIDDEKLAEVVRNEVRDMFQRMRNQRGGQQAAGAQPQPQQQQQRARVTMDQLPEAIKTAAAAVVAGFEADHAHQTGTTEDGKAIYEVDGRNGDQRYTVKVADDGTVISHGEQTRARGNRGGRGGRGNRPQRDAQPAANEPPAEADQF